MRGIISKVIFLLLAMLLLAMPLTDYNFGWKEYITIMVKGGSIVSVEYNAENASGFIKSWDNAYMQTMLHSNGTYPNEYTRYYAGQLLEGQGEKDIDGITGATSSHASFKKLAAAVLEQARKGDSSIAYVTTGHKNEAEESHETRN